ncbi:FAD-binding oxidoreductase [Curtobacterium herbarum]|uniref:FAD-binding PCMH-type domain-containing protein n=1 Tax=Curtobacterium herbarum TaxID=150122 RepID=A0ABN1Z8A6_9MICO|nr:FAD-binding protein [Curtobacterium herbarum]MBM7475927.1 FAD/FMN-containing dehydrogenase [Curtobacterium herbarum]MCS6544504.1 FAD-binding protein [Curtobacterium herbarum]
MLVTEDTAAYRAATSPHTSSVEQRPARVAVITRPEDLPTAVAEVAALERETDRRLVITTQASGHGAGATVDAGSVVFDTSGLDAVSIDREARVAVVGAGATWSAVNTAAEHHGLLGLAGSSPSVAVSGYTFGGGVGWLVRRDGLASGSLRAVHYVDGDGRMRTARDDAAETVDREAIWAFRGAGGVGIAHTLEFDLVPAPDLHAGALLWPADPLPGLVAAWAQALPSLGTSASSSLSVLHLPPLPTFPEELRGRPAVHLAVADPDGSDGARALLDAMRAVATPAIGHARWLDASTPEIAARLLAEALAPDAAVVLVELRHLAGAPTSGARASGRDGAVVTPPGDFIHHAVGSLDRASRERIDGAFARLQSVWASADAGSTPGSWVEGAAHVADALAPEVRQRAAAVADAVDPGHRFARSRLLG